MFKWLLPFLFVAFGALAQNVSGGSGGSYCPTVTLGSNANVCASTAFVVNSLAAGLNLTGDVTTAGSVATISPNVVTNAKLATMPSFTIKGNNTGSTASPVDLTAAQVSAMLGNAAVTAYGASGSAQNTTGSISASSNNLALAAAVDFANGQGIRINHAGAAFSLNQPTSCSGTARGTTGSTTYQYKVASLDAAGGVGAATSSFSVANGNAVLAFPNYIKIVCTAPTGTAPAGYAVYRYNGSIYTLVGIISNNAPTFYDVNYGVSTVGAPDFLPSAAQASSLADWLITTVSSGGGTTSLTLAVSATTTAASSGVYHDDTIAFAAAVTASASTTNALSIPCGTYSLTSTITIPTNGFNISGFGNCSVVFKVNPAGNTFAYSQGNAFIGNVFFKAQALQSSGYFIDFSSNTIGNNQIDNVSSYGGANIINLGGAQNMVSNFIFNNFTHIGVNWGANAQGSDFIHHGQMFSEPQVTASNGNGGSSGLNISYGYTISLDSMNIAGQQYPCNITPAAGVVVQDIDANHVECDSNGINYSLANASDQMQGIAWVFNGGNSGSTLQRIRCTACWGGSMASDGFYVNKVNDFSCQPCFSQSNGGHGYNIVQSGPVSISGRAIDNNLSNNNSSGVSLTNNNNHITLTGFRSGSVSATQKYGIFSDATTYDLSVCGVDAYGNVTASYSINGSVSVPACANN